MLTSREEIGFGPQLLLDSASKAGTPTLTGTVCYYAYADNSGARLTDEWGEKKTWKHNCFADLSCISKRPRGTPAFMSLRIGLLAEKRECDDAFVRWLFDPLLSPWRAYADELMSAKPMLLNWKGSEVNIHSHEFRRDVGVMLLKHVSRRVAINFLKVYRLLGEHPEFIVVWHDFVKVGMDPTDAFWSAQFCFPAGNGWRVPNYYQHSVFEYGQDEPYQFVNLLNMRDGRLLRELYANDESMLATKTTNSHGFSGCDAIWGEKHPDARLIKINGKVREVLLKRLKTPPKALVSGGLCSRNREEDYYLTTVTAPQEKVIETFRTLIQETIG